MAVDIQYMENKAKDQEGARGEHARKLLVELIDQLYKDFTDGDIRPTITRDEVIDLIERFVTKRRLWL